MVTKQLPEWLQDCGEWAVWVSKPKAIQAKNPTKIWTLGWKRLEYFKNNMEADVWENSKQELGIWMSKVKSCCERWLLLQMM